MTHSLKCVFTLYTDAPEVIASLSDTINRLFDVSEESDVIPTSVGVFDAVKKEYVIQAGSHEEMCQISCSVTNNCPAPLDAAIHLAGWSITEVNK